MSRKFSINVPPPPKGPPTSTRSLHCSLWITFNRRRRVSATRKLLSFTWIKSYHILICALLFINKQFKSVKYHLNVSDCLKFSKKNPSIFYRDRRRLAPFPKGSFTLCHLQPRFVFAHNKLCRSW